MLKSIHDDRMTDIRRVLLPVRWRPGLAGAALALRSIILRRLAASHPLAVTMFSVIEESDHDTTLADMRELRARLPVDEVNISILDRREPARVGNEDIEQVLQARGEIVQAIRDRGAERGIRTEAEVRVGSEPDAVVIRLAKQNETDLVVLGADVRRESRRLFLGPRVERILQHATCPVLVLNIA